MNLSDSKERLEMAKLIFKFADHIDSYVSGGVNPIWELQEIEEIRNNNDSLYHFYYKLPSESHPNSDVTYHVTNPDKLYTFAVILQSDGVFIPMDPEDLYFDSFCKDEIERFCEEKGLTLKSPEDYIKESGYIIKENEDEELER